MKLTEAPSTASAAPVQLLSVLTLNGPPMMASSIRRAGREGGKDGEVMLLEASLAESERRRSDAIEETLALRKLVGVCEAEVQKLVEDVLGGHASLQSGLPGDAGADEDRMISYPAFEVSTAPLAVLSTRISTLLFALRDSASIMASSSTAVQTRHEEELEAIHAEWHGKEGGWKSQRMAMEKELKTCKAALEEAEKVIEGWVANGVTAKGEMDDANVSASVCLRLPG